MSHNQHRASVVAGEEMPCQEFVTSVTDYLEKSMSPATRARFEQHLVDCPDCPFYLRQLQEIIGAAGMLQPADVSPDARAVLMNRFRSWTSGN